MQEINKRSTQISQLYFIARKGRLNYTYLTRGDKVSLLKDIFDKIKDIIFRAYRNVNQSYFQHVKVISYILSHEFCKAVGTKEDGEPIRVEFDCKTKLGNVVYREGILVKLLKTEKKKDSVVMRFLLLVDYSTNARFLITEIEFKPLRGGLDDNSPQIFKACERTFYLANAPSFNRQLAAHMTDDLFFHVVRGVFDPIFFEIERLDKERRQLAEFEEICERIF